MMILGFAIELLILVGLGWGVTRVYHHLRGSASGERIAGYTPPRGARLSEGPVERSVTEEVDARHQVNPPAPPQISAKAMREKRMAELKRLYVADEITVEQYEKDLDALLHDETGKPN